MLKAPGAVWNKTYDTDHVDVHQLQTSEHGESDEDAGPGLVIYILYPHAAHRGDDRLRIHVPAPGVFRLGCSIRAVGAPESLPAVGDLLLTLLGASSLCFAHSTTRIAIPRGEYPAGWWLNHVHFRHLLD